MPDLGTLVVVGGGYSLALATRRRACVQELPRSRCSGPAPSRHGVSGRRLSDGSTHRQGDDGVTYRLSAAAMRYYLGFAAAFGVEAIGW